MIRGFYSIGIYCPKKEVNIGSLIRTAFCYKASFIFIIDKKYTHQAADTCKTYRHIPLMYFPDIDSFLYSKPKNCFLIGVENVSNSIPLNKFSHPESCCYILVAENIGIPKTILDKCDRVVKIDYPTNNISLNVSVAGSIVLNHRFMENHYDK